MHAWYALHARQIFLTDFVNIENKGAEVLIPKLEVVGSNPIARSNSSVILKLNSQKFRETLETSRKFSRRKFQTPGMTLSKYFPTAFKFE